MNELPKPIRSDQPQPEIPTEQATIASLSRAIIKLRKELDDQRKENKNFIHWIIGGVVVIVAIVAVEIMLFHTCANKDYLDLQKNNFDTELRLQREIDKNSNAIENLKGQ